MRLENKSNLPLPLFKAILADSYNKGESDITTTQLAQPSRLWALTRRHWNDIVEDAADRLYSLDGQAVHTILERIATDPDYIVEKRFYANINGVKLGGQIDLYIKSEFHLHDWKRCAVWVSKSGVKEEWIIQANVNRWLLSVATEPLLVKRATYIALYRDWKKTEAARKFDYPQSGWQAFPIPLWPDTAVVPFIEARIASHYNALKDLPECTVEDRWATDEVWAVMKGKNKTAVKGGLKKNELAATEMAKTVPDGWVQHRPAEDKRCLHYCPVRSFCSYAIEKGYNKVEEKEVIDFI